jgi:hypothetical protein
MAFSFAFLYGILELHWGFHQLLAMSLATYGLCKAGAAGRIQTSFPWPWLVFGICMVQLTVNHTYRYVFDISLEEMEITGELAPRPS